MKEQYLQRGNKLWEGSRMFLPEHKQALIDWQKEQQKVTKPILDEQELDVLNRTLHTALVQQASLRITYYEEGHLLEIVGYVDKFFESRKELRIVDVSEQIHHLQIDNIIQFAWTSLDEYGEKGVGSRD
ncbi:YolD-like family protein [Aliibacillus thermotolerans]|uniref:YolD-like family protein n=1 Tax=Aliibacillus thermotolerans TaxID=1834418 RepID=A0ABW0U3E6_9BACI|nr:YolD-like family protein [Aliibacillus thermotolerans]MDA3129110.1 YolD-like family protein [Aliibacillus thermotolerans]